MTTTETIDVAEHAAPVNPIDAATATISQIRTRIRCGSGLHAAITARSGELLKAAAITGDRAVICYDQHYGAASQHGLRTIVLRDNGSEYELLTEMFAARAPVPAHVEQPLTSRQVPSIIKTAAELQAIEKAGELASSRQRELVIITAIMVAMQSPEWAAVSSVSRWMGLS